jgi:hypothetical protein
LKTIGDTSEAVLRLKLIDNKNSSPKLNISRENKGLGNNRSFETRLTRRIQEYPTSDEHSGYRNGRRDNYRIEGREKYSYKKTSSGKTLKDEHKDDKLAFITRTEENIPEN